jgi:hypothetical protein
MFQASCGFKRNLDHVSQKWEPGLGDMLERVALNRTMALALDSFNCRMFAGAQMKPFERDML